MFIAVINYNMGNIKSVENALKCLCNDVRVADSPMTISNASAVVLPGVGAFQDAIKNLESLDIIDPIYKTISSGKPFLGICIGLQLLFEFGNEGGPSRGLGIFKGSVEKISKGVKIPHMGWNKINIVKKDSKIFKDIDDGESFYFVHSYHVKCQNSEIISSITDYGTDIVSSVESGNLYATQFHPEKSSKSGMQVLKNFVKLSGF